MSQGRRDEVKEQVELQDSQAWVPWGATESMTTRISKVNILHLEKRFKKCKYDMLLQWNVRTAKFQNLEQKE